MEGNKFDEVFNTDWNKGNDSTMTSMERARIHDLYLEYNKYKIKMSLINALKISPDEQKGFPKD